VINCLWNAVFLGADLGERLNGAPDRTNIDMYVYVLKYFNIS
jgi:hypothetical protein